MASQIVSRFGLIGAGRIARNQIAPAIHAAHRATLYAAASRELSRAESMRPERAYDSYAALIADPQVDAVYIATHNGLHKELSIAALRAGKHAFVANYRGGTVAVLAISETGALEPPTQVVAAGKHPHSIAADVENRRVSVPVLGEDAVLQYAFDPAREIGRASCRERV